MFELFFIWLGVAVVTAIAAGARKRSAPGWFVLGLVGGVFALIAVLVLPPHAEISRGAAIASTAFAWVLIAALVVGVAFLAFSIHLLFGTPSL